MKKVDEEIEEDEELGTLNHLGIERLSIRYL